MAEIADVKAQKIKLANSRKKVKFSNTFQTDLFYFKKSFIDIICDFSLKNYRS